MIDPIEKVARALAKQDRIEICESASYRQSTYGPRAKAAITAYKEALREAGFVIAPVEPTEAMLNASWQQTGESWEMRARTFVHYARHYRAMIAAATEPATD